MALTEQRKNELRSMVASAPSAGLTEQRKQELRDMMAGSSAQPKQPSSALFPSKGGIGDAARVVGNVIPDAAGFAWDMAKAANPITNVKNIVNNVGELSNAYQETKAPAQGIDASLREELLKRGKGDIVANLEQAYQGAKAPGLGAIAKELPPIGYRALVPQGIQQGIAGDWEGAQKTLVEHPFRTIYPLVAAAQGVGKAFRHPEVNTAKLPATLDDSTTSLKAQAEAMGLSENPVNAALSKLASPVAGPIQGAATAIKNLAKKTVGYGVKQATGLDQKTIDTVIKNPDEFGKASKTDLDRTATADEIKSAIDKRLHDLSATGSKYKTVRESGQVVQIPPGTFENVLADYGINMRNGKIIIDAETPPLSSADVNAIESFYSQYGKESQLTANGFLNARKALDNMAKYDATKTDLPKAVSRGLRSVYDDVGAPQLKGSELTFSEGGFTTTVEPKSVTQGRVNGYFPENAPKDVPSLESLDAKYAPEVKLLSKLRKEYLNPDGSMKDGAINKIANATGVGKNQVLTRLELIKPGISQEINIVKALEDIKAAEGAKVGTYVRAGVGAYGAATMNPTFLIGSLLSSPGVVVPVLRWYGVMKGISTPKINLIVDKLTTGVGKLTPVETLIIVEAAQAAQQLKK